jgi:hypothetical protein
MTPLATPVYYPSNSLELNGVHPKHSELGTFRATPRWPFAFSPEPYSKLPSTHRASPFISNRPNSLRSSIHRTSTQSFDRIDAHSTYLPSYCWFDCLSGPVNPPYMRYTLHGCTTLMTKPPHPSDLRSALGVTPRTDRHSLPSYFAWFPLGANPGKNLLRSAPLLLH